MKLNILFVSVLFLSSWLALNAQSVRFKILNGDDEIGNINAHKATTKTNTTYSVTSIASFRVFFKYVRETSMDVIFQSGKLKSSETKQIMNKELEEHRITSLNGSEYLCLKNPKEEKFTLTRPIHFSTSMLYFEEPKGHSRIFAESYQQMCPLEVISPGIYKLTLPHGKINHYVYKAGELQEIRVFRTMVDLVFKRDS